MRISELQSGIVLQAGMLQAGDILLISLFMRRFFTVLFALIMVVMSGKAQQVLSVERWSGKLNVGVQKLTVGFVINTMSDGTHVCTMNVPEQGAVDIPVVLLKNDVDSLKVSIPSIGAAYNGRRDSNKSIKGIFTQNGYGMVLDLNLGGIELKRPQTPLPPYEYCTEDIVFFNEAEGAELAGTLTYPVGYERMEKGTVPVVLMVTGSGAQDRNEELFGHKPFLVIADFLAKNGIASLRYDDRGVGDSKGVVQGITTMNNLADAEAGISYLRNIGKFGKVGVIGHSEGGTIAFMLGASCSVDFLVSLAGAAAKGVDVIVGQNMAIMQLQGVPANVVEQYAAALRLLYADRIGGKEFADAAGYVTHLCRSHNLALPDAYKENLAKCTVAGGEWFTWFLGYDPATAIADVECPVMALNGKLDLQVLCKDNMPVIRKYLPFNDKNLIKEYDSLNHLFQHCTMSTSYNYGAIEETISQEVLDDIADWINGVK